jgi:adenylate kinase
MQATKNTDKIMNKYIIMGPNGSGKGTQAALLCKAYHLVHISVGDIFRWNIQSHTKLAARIQRIMNAGQLVSDDIVEEVVRARLDQHDWNYGFILDGFPRSVTQAMFFLESYDIDAVINIEVPDQAVVERMLSRRLCSKCGLDFNLISHRPKVADTCDVCGGRLVSRPDDNSNAIQERLKEYHAKTQPIIDLFRCKELVVMVDGMQPVDTVHKQICRELDHAFAARLKSLHPA